MTISENTTLYLQAGDDHPDNIYQWYRNIEAIDGGTNHELVIEVDMVSPVATNFYCEITNPNFPALTLHRNPTRVIVDFPTSTQEDFLEEINIYPNPSTDYIIIDSPESYEHIKIINNEGQIILRSNIQNNRIDISHMLPGTYYMMLDDRLMPFTKI